MLVSLFHVEVISKCIVFHPIYSRQENYSWQWLTYGTLFNRVVARFCVCLFCFPLDSKHKRNETRNVKKWTSFTSHKMHIYSWNVFALLSFSSFIISFSMLYNVNTQTKANVLQRKMQQWNHLMSPINLQLSHSHIVFHFCWTPSHVERNDIVIASRNALSIMQEIIYAII